jgi:hypothetical protein
LEAIVSTQHKWIIVLVAHDDPEIESQVLKERLLADENEDLAALLRGGEVISVVEVDDEIAAEAERLMAERTSLR